MAQDKPKKLKITIEASAAQAKDLLDRLAEDDFRARFEANPESALLECGIEVDKDTLEHFGELPSKQEIRQLRELLLGGQYDQADVGSRQLGWVCFIEPHAMPLMVTAKEGDEAG
jgi:putative modified peptide